MPTTAAHTLPAHPLHWFEIPVLDLARAHRFYETVLGTPLPCTGEGSGAMALFLDEAEGAAGCLSVGRAGHQPAPVGTVVYLATRSIDAALQRVEAAGGRVAVPKTALPDEWGYCAQITDTEGNRVGLHAPV